MDLLGKIKKAIAALTKQSTRKLGSTKTSSTALVSPNAEEKYLFDLCNFSGTDLYEEDGKKVPYAFLFAITACWNRVYNDMYVNGSDPSSGFLVITQTTKSNSDIVKLALSENDASCSEEELAIKELLEDNPLTYSFCNADLKPGKIPIDIQPLLPHNGKIRYILARGKSILLDCASTVSHLGIDCNYGGIDIYISPNLSKENTEKALGSTGKIYYLLHSEMTKSVPSGVAIRIQHGRNMHWSQLESESYNKGIYVCAVDGNNGCNPEKEAPFAKIFTSLSGNPSHAISLSTALKQYNQCKMKTHEFLNLIPEGRKEEIIFDMHESILSARSVEDSDENWQPIEVFLFNKDSIADLECNLDLALKFESFQALREDKNIPKDTIDDLDEWINKSPQIEEWIGASSPAKPLVLFGSTDGMIAALRPLDSLSIETIINRLD